jgi:hypothetical protein
MINFSYAQKEKYESLFIYNFTKYIKWPDNYNPGKFTIGVLGNSKIYASLDAMVKSKGTTGSGATLEVVKYENLGDIAECNILFISEDTIESLAEADSATEGSSVLIITDTPGMATKGPIINFIEQDGKIKFELNESKAAERKLIVSSSLTSLAILI